jgi:hypothetical protein
MLLVAGGAMAAAGVILVLVGRVRTARAARVAPRT